MLLPNKISNIIMKHKKDALIADVTNVKVQRTDGWILFSWYLKLNYRLTVIDHISLRKITSKYSTTDFIKLFSDYKYEFLSNSKEVLVNLYNTDNTVVLTPIFFRGEHQNWRSGTIRLGIVNYSNKLRFKWSESYPTRFL